MAAAHNRHPYPRIVFAGAHIESRDPFRFLMEHGSNVAGFVTLHSEGLTQMSGGTDLTPLAEAAQIPILRVRNINQPETVEWIRSREPDVLLVVGWTQLVKNDLLRVPKLACLGFHASLLPKYRGRAPVNWAIINNEPETGNTMIVLEPGADTGDIVAQRRIPILDDDDCGTIYQKVGATESDMLAEVLPQIEKGMLPRRKQDDSQATVMPKRRPEDGLIDWNRSTRDVYNWVRALTDPYPGAFTFLRGEMVWVWKTQPAAGLNTASGVRPGELRIDSAGWPCASTADGWLRLISIQRAGGPVIPGKNATGEFVFNGDVFADYQETPA